MTGTGLKAATLVAAALALSGCAEQGYSVIAATGTSIGVDIGTKEATSMPYFSLGYKRAEVAFVPTSRPPNPQPNGTGEAGEGGGPSDYSGAGETADVLMELSYGGDSSTTSSVKNGIYQRLAVGTTAVQSSAAAILLAKNAEGEIDASAAAIAAQAAEINKTYKTAFEAVVACVYPDDTRNQGNWDKLFAAYKAAGNTQTLARIAAASVTKAQFVDRMHDYGDSTPADLSRGLKGAGCTEPT